MSARASRVEALLQLVRVSLAPTAIADALCGLVLGGVVLGASFDVRIALVAPLASLCLLHGGLALNDFADRAVDRLTRASRPLVSGALSPRVAFAVGALLIAIGLGAAVFVGEQASLFAAALVVAIVGYDFAGRGPLIGPLLLASCRALDLLLAAAIGAAAAGVALPRSVALPALVYGLYVFVVARLGRLEDDLDRAPGARPRTFLVAASIVLVAAPAATFALTPPSLLHVAAFALVALAAFAPLRVAAVQPSFSHGDVARAMGLLLRRLAVLMAAFACALGEPLVAAAIVALLPFAVVLRRRFPPS
jgi:4-hydroxybenzoate polyprenyltransferase